MYIECWKEIGYKLWRVDDIYSLSFLLIHRLNKELEQKNKLIESLNCKLQSRADTPTNSHVLSESEQSDRGSFVSDEQESTNDDLDAYCYEVDLSSEYSHDDRQSTELEAHATSGRVTFKARTALSTGRAKEHNYMC